MTFYAKYASAFSAGIPVFVIIGVLFLGTGFFSNIGYSQETAPAPAATSLSADEIEKLIGPIALYPDELISIVLPASTFPLQIVQAARFLEKQETDKKLKPDESWDSSVLGLLNYPEVIKIMNDDLNWTWKLGEAVVNQQQDVMASIQLFRAKVDEAGNLTSNDKTIVIKETQIIKIESASPEVIYVPSYNPTTVVIYQTAPYPWVYSAPYPYYYSPAATFWTGMFVGAAISYGVHWNNHHHGHGYGDININRNTNITRNSTNVNRNTIKQNNRDRTNLDRGNANNWRSSGSTNRGGRPGARPGSVSGRDFGNRGRSGTGNRVGDRTGTRGGSLGSANRSRSRQGSTGSGNRQRSSSGSFGGYQRGANTSRNSQRGMSSRSNMSRSSRGSSRGGRSRSGGGRRR